MTLTALAPARAEEISVQAVRAFESAAAAMLARNTAAQKELMRTGMALVQIAQMYTEVGEAAAETLVLGFTPASTSLRQYIWTSREVRK